MIENDNPFTQYYAQLLHQGNMLQDYVRTGTYQQSVLRNISDFRGKVVLDVGAGFVSDIHCSSKSYFLEQEY